MNKATEFRMLLEDETLLVTAGAYDALSARVIEQAGFKVVLVSGFGLEASLLGKPDVGLLTMTEVVDQAKNIASAVTIPALADAEAGYGGPGNLQRTIREFERAGLAGLFIEDQMHPIFCGSLGKFKKVISAEEMVMKIKCALEARTDPDFIIAARTDTDIISLDEQIKRCRTYLEAGADMVTALPQTPEEYRRVAEEIDGPLWLYLSSQVDLTAKDLEAMGVKGLVVYPVEPLFVATKAMMDLMEELKTKGTVRETFDRLKPLNYKSFFGFIGLRQCIEWDQRYPFTKTDK